MFIEGDRSWKPLLVAFLGLILVFFGCEGSGGDRQKTKNIRLSTFLEAIDYAPYVVAREHGLFEEEFGDSRYRIVHESPFQSAAPINEALATDRIDGVFTAEVPSIIGRAAGIEVNIIWLSATLQGQVVVPRDSDMFSVADLVDREVAVVAGTSPHFGVVSGLQRSNIDPTRVEFIDMAPPDAKAAFETGEVDAWAIWPPYIEQEIVNGLGRPLGDFTYPVQVVLASRSQLVANHTQAIRRLVNVLNRAKAWILVHPDSTKTLMANEIGLQNRVVELAWDRITWTRQLDSTVVSDIQAKAEFLERVGFVDRIVDVKDELIRTVDASK